MNAYFADDGRDMELIKAEGTIPVHYNVRSIVRVMWFTSCMLGRLLLPCRLYLRHSVELSMCMLRC